MYFIISTDFVILSAINFKNFNECKLMAAPYSDICSF